MEINFLDKIKMKVINLEAFEAVSQDNAKDFVDKYLSSAIKVQRETGLNYLVILAQAALESAWGLKTVGNNFFGIKWHGKGERQLVLTTEVLWSANAKFPEIISKTKRKDGMYTYKVKDWFRKYETPQDSFIDHAKFFQENPRYNDAWLVRHDPNLFAEAVAKAGYATAPNYGDALKSVINSVKRRV